MTTSRIRPVVSAAALVLATLSLTACEAPQVEPQARALVQDLGAVEGVSSVAFAYEDLGGWENDEVQYDIDVAPGADADAVAEIAAAVYAAVRDDGDVGDAAVSATLNLADDQLSLRIFQSGAEADDVAAVVAAVVPELDQGLTYVEVDTSMREADEPLDLSVNQVLDVRASRAEVRRAETGWQALIDSVGRGCVHVESR